MDRRASEQRCRAKEGERPTDYMGNYSRDTTDEQTPWLQDHHLQRHLTVDSKVGSVLTNFVLGHNEACRVWHRGPMLLESNGG